MNLEFVFEIRASVSDPIKLGETLLGKRRIIPIGSGTVAGPRLSGVIIAGGSDWQLIRADGVAEIEARYTIRANDGALISVVNRGLRHGPPDVGPPDVMRRLTAGERVDPASYYFRPTPVFEVGPGPHDWLNRAIFLGIGVREPGLVQIRVFVVL